MIREALSYFPFPQLTAVALLIFISLFVGMLVWLFRKKRRPLIGHLECLPLEEEESHG